jgi:hypothetical protein
LTALAETDAALRLNPQDADALTTRDRILNRQIPSGLARDLDIAADFPDLSASLVAEIAVVQGAFHAYQQQLPLLAIADSVRTSLGALEGQLVHRQQEAQADVVIAQQDVDIAKAEKANRRRRSSRCARTSPRPRSRASASATCSPRSGRSPAPSPASPPVPVPVPSSRSRRASRRCRASSPTAASGRCGTCSAR